MLYIHLILHLISSEFIQRSRVLLLNKPWHPSEKKKKKLYCSAIPMYSLKPIYVNFAHRNPVEEEGRGWWRIVTMLCSASSPSGVDLCAQFSPSQKSHDFSLSLPRAQIWSFLLDSVCLKFSDYSLLELFHPLSQTWACSILAACKKKKCSQPTQRGHSLLQSP